MAEATNTKEPVATTDNPKTRFGRALVDFAQKFDELANRETNVTHKQMWVALGTEAVMGATAVAFVGSGHQINSFLKIQELMMETGHSGSIFWHQESERLGPDLYARVKATEGVIEDSYYSWGADLNMKVGDFARALIEGGFKDSPDGSRPVFLLSQEASARVSSLLKDLGDLEGARDKIRDILLLAGVGSVVIAGLQSKANEKVKVSAPTGKIPAVLPMIASTMRGLSKLF